MIRILNRRRKDPELPGLTVYIGRPSKWGNPYSHKPETLAEIKVKSREEAVRLYEAHFEELLKNPDIRRDFDNLAEQARHGHLNLECWCYPAQCHGEVIKQKIESILISERRGG